MNSLPTESRSIPFHAGRYSYIHSGISLDSLATIRRLWRMSGSDIAQYDSRESMSSLTAMVARSRRHATNSAWTIVQRRLQKCTKPCIHRVIDNYTHDSFRFSALFRLSVGLKITVVTYTFPLMIFRLHTYFVEKS
jgi:hypothetical protein